jgi:hypothetical protein
MHNPDLRLKFHENSVIYQYVILTLTAGGGSRGRRRMAVAQLWPCAMKNGKSLKVNRQGRN